MSDCSKQRSNHTVSDNRVHLEYFQKKGLPVKRTALFKEKQLQEIQNKIIYRFSRG